MIHTLRARRQQPRDVLRLRTIRHAPMVLLSCRAYYKAVPAMSIRRVSIRACLRVRTDSVPANVVPIRYDIVVLLRGLVKRHTTSKTGEAATLSSPLPWIRYCIVNTTVHVSRPEQKIKIIPSLTLKTARRCLPTSRSGETPYPIQSTSPSLRRSSERGPTGNDSPRSNFLGTCQPPHCHNPDATRSSD